MAIRHCRLRRRRCEIVGPSRRLAVRAEVGTEAVAGVEKLGQDRQLHPLVVRRAQQIVGPRADCAETSSRSEGIWTAATTIFTAVHLARIV